MRHTIVLAIVVLQFLSCNPKPSIHIPVEEFLLPNGLKAILVKREGAPVFASYIRIKVGNIEEPKGSSGLAHFFEHMAFKGTPKIGVKDYEAEKILLEKIHKIGTTLVELKKSGGSKSEMQKLQAELKILQEEHQNVLEQNEFVRIYQQNGGSDINATTSNDYTSYFVSLPSNKLELWGYLEGERLKHPVFREFYKERDVVAEERRMRYDNDPDGRLYEAFMDLAFDQSPYGINVIGYADEIQNYTIEAAKKFREQYYIPSRMIVALVGNFDVNLAKKVIKENFGSLEDRPSPEKKFPPENLSDYPREKVLTGPDQPRFFMGFHRPSHPHPDDEVFDIIQDLLCEGRSSRLFKELVSKKKVAVSVGCYGTLPGSRMDGVFAFFGYPLGDYSNKDLQKEILDQLETLKKDGPSQDELSKVLKQIRSSIVWGLKSNGDLASTLSLYEDLAGDWRYVYKIQDKIKKIKAEDVKRVAEKYFVEGKRVTVFLDKI